MEKCSYPVAVTKHITARGLNQIDDNRSMVHLQKNVSNILVSVEIALFSVVPFEMDKTQKYRKILECFRNFVTHVYPP